MVKTSDLEVVKLTLQTVLDVTPSSLQQHLRKIMNSTPSDDTVPDRLASVTPDNGANSGGEESKKKPAKRPRVKATNGGAKRGRKRKAESAACTPTQEKERDLGEDGTAMESEDGNTHDFVGELEVDDE